MLSVAAFSLPNRDSLSLARRISRAVPSFACIEDVPTFLRESYVVLKLHSLYSNGTRNSVNDVWRKHRAADSSGRPALTGRQSIPNQSGFGSVQNIVRTRRERLISSGNALNSDSPSYFTQFFTIHSGENPKTLYIDRDPVIFKDIVRHLQGYFLTPRDEEHFVY